MPGQASFYLAERMGFEPTVQFDPHTRFPSVRFRPLGHLSSYIIVAVVQKTLANGCV